MYVSADQLKANLEALDTQTLAAKVAAGVLTNDAQALARAILSSRGVAVDSLLPSATTAAPVWSTVQAAPARLPGRRLVRIAFGLYIVFLLLCSVVVAFDPPWSTPSNGTWTGMLGTLAAFAAGLPWTYLFIRALGYTSTSTHFVLMTLAGVGTNLTLFVMYLRRT